MNNQRPPRDIAAKTEEQKLIITWDDDKVQSLPYRFLRNECRCAHCVDEITGEKLLDPNTIPDDISITGIRAAGNYAIKIRWSDGHDTGLYTYQRMRSMMPKA